MCEARQGEGMAQGSDPWLRDGTAPRGQAVPGKGEGMAQGGIALKRDGNGQQCKAKQGYGVATQCALTHRQSYAL